MVQLVLEPNDLLQLPDLSVCFVTNECAVEVDSKHDKNESEWHHDTGGRDGRSLTRTDGAIIFLRAFQG